MGGISSGAFVLAALLTSSCGQAEGMRPPCPADGRWVALYVVDDPGDPERIEGDLIAWEDGWATVSRPGIIIHVPIEKILVVHENNK